MSGIASKTFCLWHKERLTSFRSTWSLSSFFRTVDGLPRVELFNMYRHAAFSTPGCTSCWMYSIKFQCFENTVTVRVTLKLILSKKRAIYSSTLTELATLHQCVPRWIVWPCPVGDFLSRVEISNHSESEGRTHQWIFQLPIFLSPETTKKYQKHIREQQNSTKSQLYGNGCVFEILGSGHTLPGPGLTIHADHIVISSFKCWCKSMLFQGNLVLWRRRLW